ncbi:DNA-binding response regulator [Cohnella suwonensis]|uniref:DNA-binding response regulator n=1 Tax=Cohnella suwonensis TaxID=696072 RepID=A0ABW0M0U1_9BACL
MSPFEQEYRVWLEGHLAASRGERLRRLRERHGFGEKCLLEHAWWPVVGSLADLHPEYEFIAPDSSHYFMDFALLRLPMPTCLESDDFGSHARDADRRSFSRGLDRQNEISLAGWHVLRFSLDKLKENPLGCQNHVRRMLTEWYGHDDGVAGLSIYEREILRLAASCGGSFTIAEACERLGKQNTFVRPLLHRLVEMGHLQSASGEKRIHRYRIANPSGNRRY